MPLPVRVPVHKGGVTHGSMESWRGVNRERSAAAPGTRHGPRYCCCKMVNSKRQAQEGRTGSASLSPRHTRAPTRQDPGLGSCPITEGSRLLSLRHSIEACCPGQGTAPRLRPRAQTQKDGCPVGRGRPWGAARHCLGGRLGTGAGQWRGHPGEGRLGGLAVTFTLTGAGRGSPGSPLHLEKKEMTIIKDDEAGLGAAGAGGAERSVRPRAAPAAQ